MTRVALRYWKLDPERDVSFFQTGNTPTRIAALISGQMDAALVSSTGVAKIVATGCCRVLADLAEVPLDYANYGVVVAGPLLKGGQESVKRFLTALIEGIYTFKHRPDLARSVLRESTSEAEAIAPLYERLFKSFRDFPTPETRGIQNVLDSLLVPKAKGARADGHRLDGGDSEERFYGKAPREKRIGVFVARRFPGPSLLGFHRRERRYFRVGDETGPEWNKASQVSF